MSAVDGAAVDARPFYGEDAPRDPVGTDPPYWIRGFFPHPAPAASTAFPKFRIYGSCGGIDLIVPSVDDRVAVEIMDELHDALFELVF